MRHFIVYKKKGEYASFPLIERKKDNYYIGFFVASKIDHCGIYDYKVMKTQDFNEFECTESYRQGYLSSREYGDRIETNDKIITAPCFYKRYYRNKYFLRKGTNLLFTEKKTIKNNIKITKEVGIPGIEIFIIFPRKIKIDDIYYIPAYGIDKFKNNIPFLIKYSDLTNNYNIIQMFNNPCLNFNEYALIQCKDHILAIFREEKCDYMSKSFSYDYGATWTYPEKTCIYGYPPQLIRIGSNILCTYGYRNVPMGIRAILINDKGEILSNEINIKDGGYYSELDKLWNRKKNKQWHIGYPVSMKLNELDIITIYYITGKDHITHISGTIWRINEQL